jgi:hypothetical protein
MSVAAWVHRNEAGSRQLRLRIQAFAILEQNGRKSVATASIWTAKRGEIKAVATPEGGVYFDPTPALRGFL